MPQAGDIIQDKYRILAPIGGGAMGLVFSAVHIATEKQVALKWLNPAIASLSGSAERFQREARATGRIHHPNVVAVHDVGEHAGQPYLAMEYLAGPTLRAHLATARGGNLQLEAALGLLFPIMRGVAAAHAAGVLHRDLKPENVLLAELPDGLEPVPKVLDFGLAKVRSETSGLTKLSMPGSVLCTYQYMAPEQFRASDEVTERVDVYALGAMLFEMLTGEPPYRADNAVDLVLQIHASEPPPLASLVPALPAELTPVVARAVAREPAARFATVEAFAMALEPFTRQHRFRGTAAARAEAHVPVAPRHNKPPSVTQAFELGVAPAAQTRGANQALGAGAVRVVAELRHRAPDARREWIRVVLGAATLFLQPGSPGTTKTLAEAPAADSRIPDSPAPAPVRGPALSTSNVQPVVRPAHEESDWATGPTGTDATATPYDASQAAVTKPIPAAPAEPAPASSTAEDSRRAKQPRPTSPARNQARARSVPASRADDSGPPSAGSMKANEF